MTEISKPLQKVRPQEKDYMREALRRFRDKNASYSVSVRLRTFPFHRTQELFNLPPEASTPCQWLGRHLVLKIIDEILDTGKEVI